MDFFNKLSKKASETYKFTKDKTTQISGELKLRGKISELKTKIDDAYTEVGKIVYQDLMNSLEVSREDVSARCEEIKSMYEEIEKLNVEILKVKNIKKCIECGAEMELGVKFCSKCGKEQPEEVENIEIKKEEPANAENAEVVEVKDTENKEGTEE